MSRSSIDVSLNATLNAQSLNTATKEIRQALGRITGNASEFQKSLDASTARVFAFGATTLVINGVTQSFKKLISTMVEVEKSLIEIESIFDGTTQEFNRFRESIFQVAKDTGQSFRTVAEGAAEFARQGLGAVETAKRLEAALILTRVSGLDSVKSVQSLTAAINGFSSAGLTAAEITNKLVAVDLNFAVSAKDLADGFARAGSTAEDARVSFDELLGIITAVQQKTSRGGAVIGNALKSIFTRLSRSTTIDSLQQLGVAIDASQTGIQKLQALSNALESISDPTQASKIKELAGGVFQINVVSAALKDLSSDSSLFAQATLKSAQATNEAYEKNEELNKSLSAQLNKLIVGFTNLAEKIGQISLAPILTTLTSIATKFGDFFNEALDPEKGSNFIKAIFKSIGSFLSGPGLVLISTAFVKIIALVARFASQGFKTVLGINSEAEKLKSIQVGIVNSLNTDKKFREQILSTTLSQAEKQKAIADAIERENRLLRDQQQVLTAISKIALQKGVRGFGTESGFYGKRKRPIENLASGFVPSFQASAQETMMESSAAREHGYKAGKVFNTRLYDGTGGSFKATVNSAEKIKTVKGPNGKLGTYVIPPNGLAAKGFVPNYAPPKIARSSEIPKSSRSPKLLAQYAAYNGDDPIAKERAVNAQKLLDEKYSASIDINKILAGAKITELPTILTPTSSGGPTSKIKKDFLGSGKDAAFTFKAFSVSKSGKKALGDEAEKVFGDDAIEKFAESVVLPFAQNVSKTVGGDPVAPDSIKKVDKVKGFVGSVRGAFGGLFDASISSALDLTSQQKDDKNADFDIRLGSGGDSKLKAAQISRLFGPKALGSGGLGDFKIGLGDTTTESMIGKTLKEYRPQIEAGLNKTTQNPKTKPKNNKAAGYIPNFAAPKIKPLNTAKSVYENSIENKSHPVFKLKTGEETNYGKFLNVEKAKGNNKFYNAYFEKIIRDAKRKIRYSSSEKFPLEFGGGHRWDDIRKTEKVNKPKFEGKSYTEDLYDVLTTPRSRLGDVSSNASVYFDDDGKLSAQYLRQHEWNFGEKVKVSDNISLEGKNLVIEDIHPDYDKPVPFNGSYLKALNQAANDLKLKVIKRSSIGERIGKLGESQRFREGFTGFGGGFIPNFADRKVGYLDGDVLADPANAEIVQAQIKKLGIKGGAAEYHKYLGNLVAQKRKSKQIKKFTGIYGVPASGKSTLMMGGANAKKADNAKFRTTTRIPILTPQDIDRVSEVVDTRASLVGTSRELDGGYLSNVDRMFVLSSSTKEEQKEILRRRGLRNQQIEAGTATTAYGRKAGTSNGAMVDSGYVEAMAISKLAKKAVSLGITPDFGLKRKKGKGLPLVEEKKIGLAYGAFSPSTVGHLELMKEAEKLGIPPKDFIAAISKEGGTINPADPHSFRTVLFTQEIRKQMAERTFAGANVVKADSDLFRGSIPSMFEVGAQDGQRRFLKAGAGSTAFVGDDKTDADLQKYIKAGFNTSVGKRTEGISGTTAREAIFSGNDKVLEQILTKDAMEFVKKNQGAFMSRNSVLPLVIKRVNEKIDKQISPLDQQLSQLPSRVTDKVRREQPEVIDIIEGLRKTKKKLQESKQKLPPIIMRKLGGVFPQKYGIKAAEGFVPNFVSQNALNSLRLRAGYKGSDPRLIAEAKNAQGILAKQGRPSLSKLSKSQFLQEFGSSLDEDAKNFVNITPVDKLNQYLQNGYLSGALDIDNSKLKQRNFSFAGKGYVPNFADQSGQIGSAGVRGGFFKLKNRFGEDRKRIGIKKFDESVPVEALKQPIAQEWLSGKHLYNSTAGQMITGPKIVSGLGQSIKSKSIIKQIVNDKLARDVVGGEKSREFGTRFLAKYIEQKTGLAIPDLHGGNYTANDAAKPYILGGDPKKGAKINIIDTGLAKANASALNEYQKLINQQGAKSKAQKKAAEGFLPNFADAKKQQNPIKGRNTFQKEWLMEQSKKTGTSLNNPDAVFKLGAKFAKKYPNDQYMMGLAEGFVPNFAMPKPFLPARKKMLSKENQGMSDDNLDYSARQISYQRNRPRIDAFLRDLALKYGEVLGWRGNGAIQTEVSENGVPLVFSGQKNSKAKPKFASLDKTLAAAYATGSINSSLSNEKAISPQISKRSNLGYLHSQEAEMGQAFRGNFGIEDFDAGIKNKATEGRTLNSVLGGQKPSPENLKQIVKDGGDNAFYETLFNSIKKSSGSVLFKDPNINGPPTEIKINKLPPAEARRLKSIMLAQNSVQSFASGFIPNFSAVNDAIKREQSAGVPKSAIYLDSSPQLKSSRNPSGLMVANTIDEPKGGYQGIQRAKKEGKNPKSYGAAGGYVPNFVGLRDSKEARRLKLPKIELDELQADLKKVKAVTAGFSEVLGKYEAAVSKAKGSTNARIGQINSGNFNNPLEVEKANAALRDLAAKLTKKTLSVSQAEEEFRKTAKGLQLSQGSQQRIEKAGVSLISAYEKESSARKEAADKLRLRKRRFDTTGGVGPAQVPLSQFAVKRMREPTKFEKFKKVSFFAEGSKSRDKIGEQFNALSGGLMKAQFGLFALSSASNMLFGENEKLNKSIQVATVGLSTFASFSGFIPMILKYANPITIGFAAVVTSALILQRSFDNLNKKIIEGYKIDTKVAQTVAGLKIVGGAEKDVFQSDEFKGSNVSNLGDLGRMNVKKDAKIDLKLLQNLKKQAVSKRVEAFTATANTRDIKDPKDREASSKKDQKILEEAEKAEKKYTDALRAAIRRLGDANAVFNVSKYIDSFGIEFLNTVRLIQEANKKLDERISNLDVAGRVTLNEQNPLSKFASKRVELQQKRTVAEKNLGAFKENIFSGGLKDALKEGLRSAKTIDFAGGEKKPPFGNTRDSRFDPRQNPLFNDGRNFKPMFMASGDGMSPEKGRFGREVAYGKEGSPMMRLKAVRARQPSSVIEGIGMRSLNENEMRQKVAAVVSQEDFQARAQKGFNLEGPEGLKKLFSELKIDIKGEQGKEFFDSLVAQLGPLKDSITEVVLANENYKNSLEDSIKALGEQIKNNIPNLFNSITKGFGGEKIDTSLFASDLAKAARETDIDKKRQLFKDLEPQGKAIEEQFGTEFFKNLSVSAINSSGARLPASEEKTRDFTEAQKEFSLASQKSKELDKTDPSSSEAAKAYEDLTAATKKLADARNAAQQDAKEFGASNLLAKISGQAVTSQFDTGAVLEKSRDFLSSEGKFRTSKAVERLDKDPENTKAIEDLIKALKEGAIGEKGRKAIAPLVASLEARKNTKFGDSSEGDLRSERERTKQELERVNAEIKKLGEDFKDSGLPEATQTLVLSMRKATEGTDAYNKFADALKDLSNDAVAKMAEAQATIKNIGDRVANLERVAGS